MRAGWAASPPTLVAGPRQIVPQTSFGAHRPLVDLIRFGGQVSYAGAGCLS